MPGYFSAHFKNKIQVTIVFKEMINELLLKTQIKTIVVWAYLFTMYKLISAKQLETFTFVITSYIQVFRNLLSSPLMNWALQP